MEAGIICKRSVCAAACECKDDIDLILFFFFKSHKKDVQKRSSWAEASLFHLYHHPGIRN